MHSEAQAALSQDSLTSQRAQLGEEVGRVQDLGFRVQGLGLGFRVLGLGCVVRCGVWCEVWGVRFQVWGLGLRVSGLFRV